MLSSGVPAWLCILAAGLIILAVIIVLWLFFYTEVGLTIKSAGDNPHMSRAQGINVKFNKVLGLAISNGIVALAGALLAQYKGSANINDGRGAIVIGLAARRGTKRKLVTENKLTTLMITHNMHDAITYGNRLIMMHEGRVVVDVSGDAKKELTIPQLLGLFEKASGSEFTGDKVILSK